MSSLEQEMFLQWGNKKRMRRLRASANKDTKHISQRQSNSSSHETFLFHSSRFSRYTKTLPFPRESNPQDSIFFIFLLEDQKVQYSDPDHRQRKRKRRGITLREALLIPTEKTATARERRACGRSCLWRCRAKRRKKTSWLWKAASLLTGLRREPNSSKKACS